MASNLKHTPGHIDCPVCDRAITMNGATITADMPFGEAFNRWIETMIIRRAGVATNARYLTDRGIRDLRQYARAAARFFGRIPLKKIHGGHLMMYQQARAICDNSAITDGEGWAAPAGANLIRKEIQIVQRMMVLADAWDKDAMERTWRPLEVVVNDVPRTLTPMEQRRWIETAASRPQWQTIYWYSILALQTACSSDELRNFRLGDIFLEQGIIEVRKGKNNYRKRTIPLQSQEVTWALGKLIEKARERGAREPFHCLFPKHLTFNRYNPAEPMTVSGIKKPWEAVRKASGLTWFRIYDLRHTAITRMVEAGMPIPVVLDFAGHVSVAMQRHYTHISMNAKRRWAASAFAGAEMPYAPGSAPMWQEPAAVPSAGLQAPQIAAAGRGRLMAG